MNSVNDTLNSIVEISKIVTSSKDFFEIKDLVIDKMLEVVPPKRACVNIFKNNTYDYTYLICKETLGDLPKYVVGEETENGLKVPMSIFPDYFTEAIKTKKYYYVEDVFKDDLAEKERALAQKASYRGRLIVPLVSSASVKGFMTCFVDETEHLQQTHIDFIDSVASLLALSIDITNNNKEIDDLLQKFRDAIISVESRADVLYGNEGLDSYFKLIAEDICRITASESTFIYVEDPSSNISIVESFGNSKKVKYASEFLDSRENTEKKIYQNEEVPTILNECGITSIAFENLIKDDEKIGKIILINSEKYRSDDLRILGIFTTQIVLSIYIYINNRKILETSFLHRDLELVNQQQQLIMEDEIMEQDDILSVDYLNLPYKYVGGDFCKFSKVDDGKYVLFIADVMGHGLVSNYFVAMMKGAINLILTMTSSPSTILTQLNSILFKELDKMDVFITAKMIFFDFKSGKAYSSSAGHTIPIAIYKDKNGNRSYKMLEGANSIAMGIFEDTYYDEDIIYIKDIELFAIYTDGIIETKNKKGVEYGVDRLANHLIDQLDKDTKPCSNIQKSLLEFSENKEREDDLTIFTLKVKDK